MYIEKILKRLIEIPSVAPNEKKIAIFVEGELKKMGFKTKRQYLERNRFNVLGELGKGSPCILLYGHLDTVAPCQGWRSDPFKLKVVGDSAYGLGTHDMKGGLTAILSALKDFKPKGFKIKVAFGVDEEEISKGANLLVKSDWLKDVDIGLVTEPGKPRGIALGRGGRVVIRILIKGKSAHGAKHELGINAIEEAAKIINSLEKIKLAIHKGLGKGSIYPHSIESKTRYLSVPEICEITLDRNFVPPETSEFVVRQVRNLVKKLNLRSDVKVELFKRATPFLMPYTISKNHPWVKLVSETVRKKYGKAIYDYGLSVADENYFATRCGLPVVVLEPAGGGDHSANEWAKLSSILELSKIINETLNKLDNRICFLKK